MLRSDRNIAVVLGALAVAVFVLSARGHPTDYDYFARLGDAFAHGRLWLEEAPSWLNELVPCGEGRWCVHLAPLPAVWVLPFLPFFEPGLAQTVASGFAGGLSAIPAYLALRHLGAPVRIAVPTTIFAIVGTTLWFTAADGRAWYISHSVAVLAGSFAVYAAVAGRAPLVVGVLIGLAALARYPMALGALGLAVLVARRRGEPLPRVIALGALGILPFAIALLAYNAVRFGSPFETGYGHLTEGDPFFPHGLFSIEYVSRHFYAIAMQAPDFVDAWPLFVRPNWIGTSVLLTSPAFVYVFAALAGRGRLETLPLGLAALLPLALNAVHGTIGFAQHGYRYWLDLQPFLLPLVAAGAAWRGGEWRTPPATFLATIAWCVLANLYAVIAIIHLEYVR